MKALTKLTIIAVGGLSAIIIIFFLMVSPTLDKVSRLNEEFAEKKTALSTLEQQARAYQTAKLDLSQATERDRITRTIVDKENLVIAIQNIEEGAIVTRTEEQMRITDRVENPKKVEEALVPIIKNKVLIEEIPYRLELKNNYVGLVNFLRYVENLPEFSEVVKLVFSAELIKSDDINSPPVRTGQVLGSFDALFFVDTSESP
jgi:hypothetical protein